jgi:hypothetical protein
LHRLTKKRKKNKGKRKKNKALAIMPWLFDGDPSEF